MNFDKEMKALENLEKVERDILLRNEIEKLKLSFQNLPNDFIDYLLQIGSGDLIKSSIKIYPSLCDFCDLGLDDVYDLPDRIMLFGDNYSGDFLCFDLTDEKDEVLEFSHESNEVFNTGKTFRGYVREKIFK